MKKFSKLTGVGVLLILVLVLVSCGTAVGVRQLVPSEINMSNYRNLAIAPTQEFSFGFWDHPASTVRVLGDNPMNLRLNSGFTSWLERDLAGYTTDLLVDTLRRTSYFTITDPSSTQWLIGSGGLNSTSLRRLADYGVDAVMTSSISYIGCDETIYSKEEITSPQGVSPAVKTRKYYITQTATVTFTYTITDTRTGAVIATRSFTDKVVREQQIATTTTSAPRMYPMYQEMVRSFQDGVSRQLAPRWVSRTISLMANKPKLEAVEIAYDMASQGAVSQAYETFYAYWKNSKHLPSGYNAAVMLEALYDLDNALILMDEVYRASGNRQAYEGILRIKQAIAGRNQAQKQ